MMAQVDKAEAGIVTCTHKNGTVETMNLASGGTLTMTSKDDATWTIEAEAGATITFARRVEDIPEFIPLDLTEPPDIYSWPQRFDGFHYEIVWRAADGSTTPPLQYTEPENLAVGYYALSPDTNHIKIPSYSGDGKFVAHYSPAKPSPNDGGQGSG